MQPNFKSRPVSAPAEVTPQQQQDLHVEYGEDLRVKGLTQDNHNSGTSSSSSTEKQHAPSSKLSRPLAPLGRDLMPSPQRLWPAPPSTQCAYWANYLCLFRRSEFDFLNIFFAFLSIVCDIGAIYYSYFLDFRSFESALGPKNGSKGPKLAISWP